MAESFSHPHHRRQNPESHLDGFGGDVKNHQGRDLRDDRYDSYDSYTKQIVAIKTLKSERILGASQDGSRGFIILIATICADGSCVPPALIYQGASHDLQGTWIAATRQ